MTVACAGRMPPGICAAAPPRVRRVFPGGIRPEPLQLRRLRHRRGLRDPGADRCRSRFDLTLQCQWHALCSFESISGGVVAGAGGDARPPVCHSPDPGRDTSVWDIAKGLQHDPGAADEANELQEDVIPAGTLLLLPLA